MALTQSAIRNSNGINYTYVTDSSTDWASVPNSTYFKDLTDGLIHYKDSTGTVQEIFSSGSGITVGTTAVTSGTDGRVFFQAGGVLQQSANLTFTTGDFQVGNGSASSKSGIRVWNGTTTNTAGGEFYIGTDNHIYVKTNNANELRFATPTTNVLTIGSVNQASITRLNINGASTTPTFSIGAEATTTSSYPFFISGLASSRIHIMNGAGQFGINKPSNTLGANLDISAPGATNLDIAFRVRNSGDTADLISFRGDGSQWIQSVPFIHAGTFTGTTNATQSLHIGYNAAAINSASSNSITIGRGTGALLSGNNNISIGNANSIGGFSSMLGIGLGVQMNAANTAFIGSETYPYSTMWVSTGGEVSSGANLRGLDFRVSGCVGGLTNQSASGVQLRFFSPNGTGSGAGSNIQFHVAPSNTGGASFNRNIFSEMFTIRGEADGLNHYQLSTPRVPSASITDGYIQYSNDITAGNAAPHFRTELGDVIKLYKNAAVTTPQGIADALTNLGVLTASTIAPSVQSVVSAATVTPVNGNDLVKITAQAAALTLANPTGTWPEGKDLMIRIKDDGLGARAITWDTNYRAIGVTLPTTTVLGKTTYVGVIYNSDDAKWDVIGVTTQA